MRRVSPRHLFGRIIRDRPLMRQSRSLATIAVGMSGGVDSSVAALLLRDQGHDVIGLHMTNWDNAEEGSDSCTERDARDAERVCAHIGVGFQRVSFIREYWHDVFEPLLQRYHEGSTPNPDIECNRRIKFSLFVDHARSLGADLVATGHYARVEHDAHGVARLLCAADRVKDQTYFLSQVPQASLQVSAFPLGHLQKDEVRALASTAGLHTATKRDSTGICFIGKRKFGDFLEGYLPQEPGPFVCIESGRVVGEHRGYARYTPGQRARCSGMSTRWYVVDKEPATNVVRICEGAEHPALFTRGLVAEPPPWILGEAPAELLAGQMFRCISQFRHPGRRQPCTIELRPRLVTGSNQGSSVGLQKDLVVHFDTPVRDVAEGQIIAFYDGDVCLGGAPIRERAPTLWEEALGMYRVGWSGMSGSTFISG